MKNLITKNTGYGSKCAFTLLEAIIVVVLVAVIAILLLPSLAGSRKSVRVKCASNLKQVGLAFSIWEGANGGFPMQVYTNQSGAQLYANAKDAFRYYQVMSNELSNPYVLFCPEDKKHTAPTNFTSDFNGSHISFFIGLDATDKQPQAFLAGDSDIIGGKLRSDGIMEIPGSQQMEWSNRRHKGGGNVLLADGSVEMYSTEGLRSALQHTGLATNRLLMPDAAGK